MKKLLTALAAICVSAGAMAYPDKPITIVVPFPAGGGTDAFARPLTAVLTKNLGQQFVIENKGGEGTNVGATVAALLGLGAERRLVVILGGDGKGQDFAPLAEPLQRHARAAVLIGQDAPRLQAALAGTGVPLQLADSLPDAVQRCQALAQPGDAVLLSPACASMDMFRNYAHRAEVFVTAVQALALDAGATA